MVPKAGDSSGNVDGHPRRAPKKVRFSHHDSSQHRSRCPLPVYQIIFGICDVALYSICSEATYHFEGVIHDDSLHKVVPVLNFLHKVGSEFST